jgi:hypothetical protein
MGNNDQGNIHNGEEAGEDAEPEEPEGYKHFCEHFRINPGSRCTECNKCDLYLAEDEEAVARRAGEKAEREWRMRQGMVGVTLTAPAASRGNYMAKKPRHRMALGSPAKQRQAMAILDGRCLARRKMEIGRTGHG